MLAGRKEELQNFCLFQNRTPSLEILMKCFEKRKNGGRNLLVNKAFLQGARNQMF